LKSIVRWDILKHIKGWGFFMHFQSATRLKVIIGTLLAMVVLAPSLPVAAQSNSAIAQQFQTTEKDITVASLVGTQQGKANSIELATAKHANRLVGVVSDYPLIELSNGESGVQVVTSGLTKVLVSDLNGAIAAGDKITISPIEGVGMKAMDDTTIVGTAQAALTDTQTKTIKDIAGKDVPVHIGLIPVQVGVVSYNAENGKKTIIPSFLQEVANNVAGRNVSAVRVLMAALILLLLFVSVTILLYSAVRSSIISIGRNPLSERAVRKSLLQVGLTVLGVLSFAVALVYIVLRV
jgi:hypothetical protein